MRRRDRGNDRSGGQASRKKAKWFSRGTGARSGGVPRDARGVIVTCDGGKERAAARDVARNLEDIVRAMRDESAANDSVDASATVRDERVTSAGAGDELERELAELRERTPEFHEVPLDLRACTFVAASSEVTDNFDVADIVRRELERVKASGMARSRYVLRLVPVDAVCFAGAEEIAEAAKPLIEKHFPADKEQTFAISVERRANSEVRRMDVINGIANQIEQPRNKVNLSEPDVTIMVEIIKGIACLSVVRDYEKLFKYNVRLCAMTDEERAQVKAERAGNIPPPRVKDHEKPEDEGENATKEEA